MPHDTWKICQSLKAYSIFRKRTNERLPEKGASKRNFQKFLRGTNGISFQRSEIFSESNSPFCELLLSRTAEIATITAINRKNETEVAPCNVFEKKISSRKKLFFLEYEFLFLDVAFKWVFWESLIIVPEIGDVFLFWAR